MAIAMTKTTTVVVVLMVAIAVLKLSVEALLRLNTALNASVKTLKASLMVLARELASSRITKEMATATTATTTVDAPMMVATVVQKPSKAEKSKRITATHASAKTPTAKTPTSNVMALASLRITKETATATTTTTTVVAGTMVVIAARKPSKEAQSKLNTAKHVLALIRTESRAHHSRDKLWSRCQHVIFESLKMFRFPQ